MVARFLGVSGMFCLASSMQAAISELLLWHKPQSKPASKGREIETDRERGKTSSGHFVIGKLPLKGDFSTVNAMPEQRDWFLG